MVILFKAARFEVHTNTMQNFGNNLVGLYEKALPASLAWAERLEQAAGVGYDFLEMAIDDTDERLSRLEWTASERMLLGRAMENAGLPVLTIGLSAHRKFPMGSASPQVRARGLEILHDAIMLAADLGVRIIQLMGYDVFYETSDSGTQARFLDGLAQGASWAGAAGVMLALENVDVDTVDSVEKALRFVREVNSPWLNLYPDIGNMTAAGYSAVEQLPFAKGYMVGIHVKDALPGEVRGVVFEKGIVPFDDVFQYLAEQDFSGPMAVEMWAHLDTTGSPLQACAQARQLVTLLIQRHKDKRLEETEGNL